MGSCSSSARPHRQRVAPVSASQHNASARQAFQQAVRERTVWLAAANGGSDTAATSHPSIMLHQASDGNLPVMAPNGHKLPPREVFQPAGTTLHKTTSLLRNSSPGLIAEGCHISNVDE
eukprot:EC689327.1.p2 GENE.EC689327.1~~EC689327.1.p2  ORF type:complete len:119 (+),score=10.44 EC689327.1:166-522(+)